MSGIRQVRMGIDVGGTYTKCVAIDNRTHEILIKNQVKTTHNHKKWCSGRLEGLLAKPMVAGRGSARHPQSAAGGYQTA